MKEHNIRKILGLRTTKGDIGLEIEAEFTASIRGSMDVPLWRMTHDGSLRGEAIELVLSNPVNIDRVPRALDEAFEFLDNQRLRTNTDNCSVHVHLNCQDLTIKETCLVACSLTILEPVLLELCDESRRGNLFCLDADSSDIYADLTRLAFSDFPPSTNSAKYAGINISSLGTFGSIEMRHFSFPATRQEIEAWVNALHSIKVNTLKMFKGKSPTDLLDYFSSQGSEGFIENIAPSLEGLCHRQVANDCMYNMRLIQPVLYALIDREEKESAEEVEESGNEVNLNNMDRITHRIDLDRYVLTLDDYETTPTQVPRPIRERLVRDLPINLANKNYLLARSTGRVFKIRYNEIMNQVGL